MWATLATKKKRIDYSDCSSQQRTIRLSEEQSQKQSQLQNTAANLTPHHKCVPIMGNTALLNFAKEKVSLNGFD